MTGVGLPADLVRPELRRSRNVLARVFMRTSGADSFQDGDPDGQAASGVAP